MVISAHLRREWGRTMAKNILAGDSGNPLDLTLWPDGFSRPVAPPASGGVVGFEALVYIGAFKIPGTQGGSYGTRGFNNNAGGLAYCPERNSIFITSDRRDGNVAEFSIPALVISNNLADLNNAVLLQPVRNFLSHFDGSALASGTAYYLNGLYYYNNKLLTSCFIDYYKSPGPYLASNIVVSGVSNLATATFGTPVNFNNFGQVFVGWKSPIPAEHQAALGGTHSCGWSTSTYRADKDAHSRGPSIGSFNAHAAMDNPALTGIEENELANYFPYHANVIGAAGMTEPQVNDYLYNTDLTNGIWTHVSEAGFGCVLPGTDTYMVFGRSGGHESGIAYGTPPYGGDKGYYTIDQNDNHAMCWAFDIADLAEVYAGTNPDANTVMPTSYGRVSIPFASNTRNLPWVTGGCVDEANGIIYLMVRDANDLGGYNRPPVIVAYRVAGA